jgi:hypothetical protein
METRQNLGELVSKIQTEYHTYPSKYFLLALTTFIFYSCTIGKSHKNENKNSKPIEGLIGSKSDFLVSTNGKWIEDSIGSNGFRFIASDKIMRNYSLKNDDWSMWRNYFGKANGSYKYRNDSLFVYSIFNFEKNPMELQEVFFRVYVSSEGKIIYAAFSIGDIEINAKVSNISVQNLPL